MPGIANVFFRSSVRQPYKFHGLVFLLSNQTVGRQIFGQIPQVLYSSVTSAPFSQQRQKEEAKEGWEYARLFTTKFHAKQRKTHMVRRRLWLRKMITTNPDSEPLFTFQSSRDNIADTGDDKEDGSNKSGRIPTSYAPRMYITFKG